MFEVFEEYCLRWW